MRLYWGWGFMVDGWGKLQNLDKVTEFFASLGIPMPGPQAAAVGLTQLVFGPLMLIGLGGRILTIPLVLVMIGAFLTSDFGGLQSLWMTSEACSASQTCVPLEEATAFSYLMAPLIVLLFGAGPLSADGLIKSRSA